MVLTIHTCAGQGPGTPITAPGDITSLPTFNATFLALLAISHAGYLIAKTPSREEDSTQNVPDSSLADLNAQRTVQREQVIPPTADSPAAYSQTGRIGRATVGDRPIRTAAPAPTLRLSLTICKSGWKVSPIPARPLPPCRTLVSAIPAFGQQRPVP
jgi:hypothetical protein